MEIRTKFGIKQKVWVIRLSEVFEKCPICDGKERIKYKGEYFRCPECDGDGKVRKIYPQWVVKFRGSIKRIIINCNKEISYDVDYENEEEKNLFSTKEEAQKECDKRNGAN